ncbi:hypothetical protein PENTCL1PPCAC_2252 [Pristionchus entomophagus]|uniref:Cap-specific mRNA (nucleoside-2'-O-)-methyltransferase 1 n=1 Tax=Pristionchus entomophagus TaxID=358040 RepID=A0AAV5SBN0_9BILA|nr:hypothetical protein PENTCL1PPCAC_2252 [Pristionchus entomophagus]
MEESQSEIELSPLWLIANKESRERVVEALEKDQWRPQLERTKSETSLAEERLWCDPEIFEKLMEMKKDISSYDVSDMEKVRKRSNPHEPLLENRLMIGRYSILLASIDRVTNFLLTSENVDDAVTKRPLDTRPYGKNINRESEMFYFAESQTLPIPFASQYIWLRKGFYNAKCFSLQLSPSSPLSALVSQSFLDTVKRVGHKKTEDQDEICNPYEPSLREVFMELIERGTHGKGVDLYAGFTCNMSPFHDNVLDGGDGQVKENEGTSHMVTHSVKEILFRDSYVAQLLYATRVVKEGGRAILHFLDTNTSLSMAVIYLTHIIFHRVSIYKPNMSRPFNSERFLICDGLRSREAKVVRKYIEESLQIMRREDSLIRLIPDKVMDEDRNFLDYARNANDKLAERQYRFLESFHRMLDDEQRVNLHQKECLETCLPYYLIPYATQDEMKNLYLEMKRRTSMDILSFWSPDGIKPQDFLRSLSSFNLKMSPELLKKKTESKTSLLLSPCADLISTLIVATNNGLDFWSGSCNEWIGLSRLTTILPTDSILLGDVIETPSRRTLVVRILDVGVIFGDDISSLPFKKRLQAAEKLVEGTRKDGARQDVIFSVAHYQKIDQGWKPTSIRDKVVENEIYFMKKRIRIVEESNVSFYNMAYGEKVWDI